MLVNFRSASTLRPLLHTTIQPFSGDAGKKVETYVLVNGEQAFHRDGQPMLHKATQAEVHACWADLTDRYIVSLPGFGRIIRQADKARFEASRAAFQSMLNKWVDGFRVLVKGDHEKRVARIVDLIEARMAQSPAAERLSRQAIDTVVRSGMDRLRVIEPSVKVVYKNITVESTRDVEFLEALEKAIPGEELKGWFHIYDAAPVIEYR